MLPESLADSVIGDIKDDPELRELRAISFLIFPMSTSALLFTSFVFIQAGFAQQVGSYWPEVHPTLKWQKCTRSGGCTTVTGSVVLDANWRWIHQANGYTNCYRGDDWDTSICTSNLACAQNCALDGADYAGTYGISTNGNALTLKLVQTNSNGKNIGARVYLLENDSKYQMFNLLNQEVAFDIDVSTIPCGVESAVSFLQMDADGGMARFATNKAGAKYGTGYCDATCPHNVKFINGEANAQGWTPSNDVFGGAGRYGSCCPAMNVWDANRISNSLAAHPCDTAQQTRCDGSACGGQPNPYGGVCDPDGCDFNPYRMGDRSFYGPAATVDTTRKFTVVTQFFTNNNSTSGTLSEIRRFYIQDGRIIQNSKTNVPGMSPFDYITNEYCNQIKTVFKETDSFGAHGGLSGVGKSMQNGMVLAFYIDEDPLRHMLWLDGSYPEDADPSVPGVVRGPCYYTPNPGPDVPAPSNPVVTYSNVRFGEIGSTYSF